MSFATLFEAADAAARQHLGSTVRYTPGEGEAVDVQGIFDAQHVRVEAGEAGVTSASPAVHFWLAELPSDPEVDGSAQVTVGEQVYRVRDVQKDGQGGVLLLLHVV